MILECRLICQQEAGSAKICEHGLGKGVLYQQDSHLITPDLKSGCNGFFRPTGKTIEEIRTLETENRR